MVVFMPSEIGKLLKGAAGRGLDAGMILSAMMAGSSAFAASAPKGDKAFGAYLSSACVTCHQASGKVSGGIPAIIAWPEEQFVAVMNAYRKKERDNQVMQTIAAALSDEEVDALAAYFGALALQPEVK